MTDEPIPCTSFHWPVMAPGDTDIPRSNRAECYRPGPKLSEFVAYVKAKDDLYAPIKSAIVELAEEFRREHGRER